MKKITLKNDFHGTEITLYVKNGIITPYQVRRAWRNLCGVKGCNCSDNLGCRGKQEVEYTIHQNEFGEIYAKLS